MSQHIEIRHVGPEQLRPWVRTMRTALLADPGNIADSSWEYWADVWEESRIFGAYDGGRCVGTLRTFGTALSVPTGPASTADLPTDALTQVAVAGTHRRRGLLRGMLTRSLREAAERGEAVSLLRAAEWPIYGRFGYWPCTMAANYRISTAGPITQPEAAGVDVLQLEPEQLLQPAAAVLERVRRSRHGHIARPDAMWRRFLRLHRPPDQREPVCVVARNGDGEIDGYAVWTGNDGDWYHDQQQAQARVDEVVAATDAAERALWRYLLNLDLVRVLTLDAYPVDLPLEWLVPDGRIVRRTWVGDNDWLRILDVPGALQARRYQATDRLVLDIVDEEGGYAAGRFLLDGGPGHAECTRTTGTPDLRLSQRALAAIYLGGNTVRSQQRAGLLAEETPGAAGRLNLMFRTEQAPWNATPF
jgi:predicted acetyltransferase